MKSIRLGVFETNSSNTHSLTICLKEDYEKWKNGELFLDKGWSQKKQFITKEEAIKRLKNVTYLNNLDFEDEEAVNQAMREQTIYTSEHYFDNDCLESFEDTFTTPKGEVIVCFGKYGHD
jgi:hypothetical protein